MVNVEYEKTRLTNRPEEWTPSNNLDSNNGNIRNNNLEKTQVGREAKQSLQGFIRFIQFLPQGEVNKLPEGKKEAIQQKLGPSLNSTVNNNVQLEDR